MVKITDGGITFEAETVDEVIELIARHADLLFDVVGVENTAEEKADPIETEHRIDYNEMARKLMEYKFIATNLVTQSSSISKNPPSSSNELEGIDVGFNITKRGTYEEINWKAFYHYLGEILCK